MTRRCRQKTTLVATSLKRCHSCHRRAELVTGKRPSLPQGPCSEGGRPGLQAHRAHALPARQGGQGPWVAGEEWSGGRGRPTAGGCTEGTHFTLSSCSPNSSSLKPKWSMKAEVMRCIWKSTKACGGQPGRRQGGGGGREGGAGRWGLAHLLQHSLLGEAELLEPVVLVVAGGVQVVGVHLGGGSWA